MAEFLFYMGPIERRRAVEDLLALDRYILVPKRVYRNDTPVQIQATLPPASLEELVPNLSVLIFGPYSQSGPVMRPLPSGKAYRVSLNQGGPMLQLNLPSCWPREDGRIVLSAGVLSRQSAFWDSAFSTSIPASRDLKVHQKRIQQFFQARLRRIDDKEPIWVGTEALSLVDDGAAVFQPESMTDRVLRALRG